MSELDTLLQVSLAFGLGVMSIACFTGHISGGMAITNSTFREIKRFSILGNLNPAVSLGLLVGGQLSLIKALCIYQTVKISHLFHTDSFSSLHRSPDCRSYRRSRSPSLRLP